MAAADEELLALVKSAAQEFQHLSPAQCRESLEDLLERVAQRPADLSPDVCKALLTFIVSVVSLRCAGHRPLQWSCLELIRYAGQSVKNYETATNAADIHNFFFRLAKKEVKGQPTWKPKVLLPMLQYVLRWVQASGLAKFAETQGDSGFKIEVVTALMDALYGEMGRCDRWEPRWQFKASRALRKVLRTAPQGLEHAAGYVGKRDEVPSLLISALAAECEADAGFRHRAALLEAYVRLVLEAKQPASDYALEVWGPFLATVTAEELEGKLLPVAVRMSKRNFAAIAHSVPCLAAHLKLDFTQHAKEILEPFALEIIKDKDKRPRGRRLVQYVAGGSVDPAAPVAVAEAWSELLKKAGKTDDKQAVMIAIRALVGALPEGAAEKAKEGLGRLANSKGAVAKSAGDDANEDTRSLGYRAMGALALLSPADAQTSLVQELLKPLTDKKAPAKAALAALESLEELVVCRHDGTSSPSWMAAVLEKAVPLLVVAVTKPVQRQQSLLAWAACSTLAATDKEALASRLKKDHLAVLKEGPSFLNAVPTILKSPVVELALQARLWRALLCGHVAGLPPLGTAASALLEGGSVTKLPPGPFSDVLPLCRSTVVLLAALHGGRPEPGDVPLRCPGEKRLAPRERIGLLAACDAAGEAGARDLLLLLTQALVCWLAELAALPASQRQVGGAALRGVLLDICAAAAAGAGRARPETLALLALAVHHPVLASSRWPAARLWDWLSTKGPLAGPLGHAPRAAWPALREALLAGLQLPAKEPTGFRRACIGLAASFDVGAGNTPEAEAALRDGVAAIVQDCIGALHSEEAEKEKEENVSIFFAQEGRLWREEGTYIAEERENNNVKRNKYLKDLYGDDDLCLEKAPAPAPKFAPPDRKGKDKAGGKAKAKAGAAPSGGNMTASDIEAAKIQEQAEIRARIRAYVDEAFFALDVLSALAGAPANAALLEAALPELVPHLAKLLRSPLTALKARSCARALCCSIVSEKLVLRRELLPDALMVVGKGWLHRSPQQAGTPGETPVCEVVLDSVDTNQAMPMGTLAMVLPVMLRTLHDGGPALQKVCARSLLLLERQLVAGAQLPATMVKDVFDSLGVALLGLPGLRVATQAALLAAGRHLVSTEDQLAQLADMFFSEEELVRSAVISALAEVKDNPCVRDESLDPGPMRAVLRLGALDPKTEESARSTIDALEFDADEVLLMELIELASKKAGLDANVQGLIAKAVAEVLAELEDPAMAFTALDLLTQLFREDATSRIAVARCLERVFAASLEGEEQVVKAFRFLLRQGLGLTSGGTPEATELRDVLLAAGIALVERHGEEHADVLFEAIEDFEDSGVGAAAGESAKLGVAVFLGALSKHLNADHAKVPEILPRLLQRLLDPASSTSVQNAIVKVMPPLMKQNREQATETLEQLMETALAAKTQAVTRRGAAMGLGATVKGLSIQAVSQHGILKKVEAAAENKKEGPVREGALLCLEGLTLSLGRLFDPYVVSSLPLLLQAFSDPSQNVRAASQSAAGAMMSQLSGPGVKQVLKPLLEGIKDKQWRTKLGSIELLAAMTSCLPKQLAACLPQVVPALCGVINDQHAKVKEAARVALDKIGSIITSPELRNIAPELITALTDGAQFEHITRDVLDKLLSTSFVHHIDAPSLSLVCPLVQRALKERSAEMKRKGAQIVGSMVLLIKDAKDIQPYLPLLLPQLKVTLVDPIPDVRATAAKAFGTLANGLPEEMLGDVLPWLFNMLRSAESAVERSGAAHGLSEVLMAMGMDRIEMLLPDILANARNKEAAPEVKEGYLGLFVYLPVAMGQAFEPYVEEVLQALLKGVSDDTSSVRDTAFKAAQVITKQFGASHTAKLLQPLEEGVFDVDWRIRHASVQLMGQLIEQILRAHRIPTNSAELMQCDVLPKEWRAHMLASLYIVRSDENPIVKQACSQVWKAVVQNTPRTLKELLPALMTRLIANLASTNREKQRVAARCVGDLVSKLGERVMPELMPIFMNTLSTGDAHVREGVCIGLAELINATTKQLLADYIADLIPAIRQAIIDDVPTVRNSASLVVALLHNAVGPRATTDVVTWVLAQLQEGEVEEHGHLFLNGLEQLMAKQPSAVLPIVLSRLTVPGEDGFTKCQMQGLASLAVVPDGHTVHRHLSDVLPVMIGVAADEDADEEVREAAVESAARVMDRVEQGGLNLLFAELIAAVTDQENAKRRATGARLFERFFEQSQLDVVSILPQALPAVLLPALADSDSEALASGVKALNSIVKRCKKEELAPYLSEVRDTVLRLITDPATKKVDPSKLLPGLCHHNGLEPLYPIYQHGLMFGSAEARELAAKGLGELVDHTTEQALKPYVVKITGPLIRIVGDRFPGTVKKAIVDTLKSLLVRGGPTLKPFLPQLQTTYVKCLADPSEAVRQKAAESLGTLVRLSARTEPLINELAGGTATHADPAVRLAMCTALGEVLLNVPQPASEAAQDKVLEAVLPRAFGGDEGPRDREVAAWAFAAVLRRHVTADRALELLQEHVVPALEDSEAAMRHAGAFALAGACWCQQPQMPAPAGELLERLQGLLAEWLPPLLADTDADILAAAAALFAAAARLHAEASLDWGMLTEHGERFASLVAPGPLASSSRALSAARHVGCAAAAAGVPLPSASKLGLAVATRGVDKDCEVPEDAERAMAALLGLSSADEGEARAAMDKFNGKAAPALRDYVSKRLKSIAQCSLDSDFAWDF